MAIILLLISFITIFLNLRILLNQKYNSIEVLISTVLIYSTLIVLVTEISSIFYILNYTTILLFWTGITLLNLYLLFIKRNEVREIITAQFNETKRKLKELSLLEKIFLISILFFLILIFIQGVVYPPNNWDSMTYHMARIPNWISHQSISHYLSHIVRQLYQPPFSEFVIMQFNVLSRNDYFSNTIQFLFLIFSIFPILLLMNLFELKKRFKLISIVLLITIPEVILQASSTQNDIVVSFFILSAIYFAVKSIKEATILYFIFFGFSVGLAILTKGTAYIFLAPILLIFATTILVRWYKTRKINYITYSIIALIIFLSINSGHYLRNYNLNQNILGVDKSESKMYSNSEMSPMLLMSSILKNMGNQIGPNPLNKVAKKVIYKLHSIADIDINSANQNFNGLRFGRSPDFPNHEDSASNPLHFYLIFISFCVIGFYALKKNIVVDKFALLLTTTIILQVILFCSYLKWQPWHTRLHTPLFMMAIPLICYAASINKKFSKIIYWTFPIIIIFSFSVILLNSSRPFITKSGITSSVKITDNRFKKYFANRPDFYEEYNSTLNEINQSNLKNVGLIIGCDDWEYPLFYQIYNENINPIHINVIGQNNLLSQKNIDCIVSTTINKFQIKYKGRTYYNQNEENKTIWLYK